MAQLRNPHPGEILKKEFLEEALGADAVEIMRDIKSVLDPKWLLNQNKMFPTGAGAMESFLLALPTLEGLTPG